MDDREGTLADDDGGHQLIRFERRLPHAIERVWAAITDPGQLRGWWGEAQVELVPGGRFDVQWLNDGGPLRRATITALDPPRLVETDGEPHGRLRFELRPDGDGTVLTFTAALELAEEWRGPVLTGWHWHLDALAGALDGAPQPWLPADSTPGWLAVGRRYGVSAAPRL